ncbi:DUF6573 family protein [Streptomyces achromogenes]|uniref:DUF6573 family protein n=1 Tax=Streptomyces achromogenes TaxID=67255 RepID=UPI001AE0128F|nr:DUF6573 family protein [Streptomyces achromogenes]
MATTTHPATSSRPAAQKPAPNPADVPAPTAPTADLPRNLVRLTARAEAAGWVATVEPQPGHCALLLTALQKAGETDLRCVWRFTAQGYRWDGATLTRYGQTAAEGIAWRAAGDLAAAEAPTARTQPTAPDLSPSVYGKRDAQPVTAEVVSDSIAATPAGEVPVMLRPWIKKVRVKLPPGYSHEQIRDEHAQAQAAGNAQRANGLATMLTVHTAMAEEDATNPRAGSQRRASRRAAREDDMLSRTDSVLYDVAVMDDPSVSDDTMRSVPLADPGEIIHVYSRAQALADGVLVAADADLAREAGFRVPVALTSAVWEGCVAWNDGDSERQTPQDERGRLWDVLTVTRHAIRRSGGGGDRVTVDLRRVPRDGRTTQARPAQLVCVIGPGDQGEPVITIMQPDED